MHENVHQNVFSKQDYWQVQLMIRNLQACQLPRAWHAFWEALDLFRGIQLLSPHYRLHSSPKTLIQDKFIFIHTPFWVNWIKQVVPISTKPGFSIWSYRFKITSLVTGSALPSVELRLQDSVSPLWNPPTLFPALSLPFQVMCIPHLPCVPRTAITKTGCFSDCNIKDLLVCRHHLDTPSLAAVWLSKILEVIRHQDFFAIWHFAWIIA